MDVPLHLQGAMKSLPAHAHPHNQSDLRRPAIPTKTTRGNKILKKNAASNGTRESSRDRGASLTVSLEADPALELLPAAARFQVDLRRRRDQRRRRLILHRRPPLPLPTTASAGASRTSSAPRPSESLVTSARPLRPNRTDGTGRGGWRGVKMATGKIHADSNPRYLYP